MEEENGASFNGRRIRQLKDGTFLVDAQKFVEDRLSAVPLEKGRTQDRKQRQASLLSSKPKGLI